MSGPANTAGNGRRVLHVVWEYPPVMYGGLARHAENLAQAQVAAGCQVTVLTSAEDVRDPGHRIPATVSMRHDVRVRRARRPSPRRPWSDLVGAAEQLATGLIIDAEQELADRPPDDVRMVLAGRGSDAPRLQALAAELGVTEAITMPGWLSRHDLAALYAAADAVVVPSRYEPYGLVAREAQAAGASVIAAATGGLLETVRDEVTGLLMGVGDVHGLRDRLLGLAADPDRARRLGVTAAREVASWTWAEVAAATGDVYHRVIAGRPVRDQVTASRR